VTDAAVTTSDKISAPAGTVTVLVRYFAGAMAAAGVAEEHIALPAGSTVGDILAAVRATRGRKLVSVLPACSFLLDGTAVHDHGTVVSDGSELDVLPPFAGG
jgi:molybdopterin converting factor small subunit